MLDAQAVWRAAGRVDLEAVEEGGKLVRSIGHISRGEGS
jgi:hypothetical protein